MHAFTGDSLGNNSKKREGECTSNKESVNSNCLKFELEVNMDVFVQFDQDLMQLSPPKLPLCQSLELLLNFGKT